MINLILQQDVNNQVLSVNLNVLKEMKHLEIIYIFKKIYNLSIWNWHE